LKVCGESNADSRLSWYLSQLENKYVGSIGIGN